MDFGHVICCLLLYSVLLSVVKAEFSPALSWDVCSPSKIVVTLTGGADGGIVYIRGYGSACKQDTTSEETAHEFEFETCGIAKAETYFTIIVQKHPLYQTGEDLQESLLCIIDLSDISVGGGQSIGGKNEDDNGINKTVKPAGAMKLYNDGVDISGSDVKLTDLITMTIQLDDEYKEDFDIKAKSCTANYIEITTDLCSTDTDLFPDFVHVAQGVVTSSFGAFRTTDLGGGSVEMVFACTLQVCRGLCAEEACVDETSLRKRKRAIAEDVAFENLNVGTSMSVGTDIDVNVKEKDAKDSLCIANVAFIVGLLVILSVLVTSMSLTTIATGKLIKRTEQLRKFSNVYNAQEQDTSPKPQQSVSVRNTDKEAVAVRTKQYYNCKTSTATDTTGKDKSDDNVTKRGTLRAQSPVCKMFNPSEVKYTGNQASDSLFEFDHLGNKVFGATKTCNDATKRDAKTQDNIPEAKTISEKDLYQLKQYRDMLEMMTVDKMFGKNKI